MKKLPPNNYFKGEEKINLSSHFAKKSFCQGSLSNQSLYILLAPFSSSPSPSQFLTISICFDFISHHINKYTGFQLKFGLLFRQKIGGYKAEGCGSKLAVFIGDKGKVLAVARIWRRPKPYKEYPLIALDEAIKELKSGKALCSIPTILAK